MTTDSKQPLPMQYGTARWFVRGDIDGFFGLALDNLVQLLLIDALCRAVLGFGDSLLYSRILPGVAVSLVIGNFFYAYQSKRLAERTGRADVCALPYGINTVSLFAHVFLVMLPAKLTAERLGFEHPDLFAYRAGLLATIGSGIIELGGAPLAARLRRIAPRAALLATLSGIALGFIALGFLFRTFAHPLVGLLTLGVVLLTYFGRVQFRLGVPGGLVAVALGVVVAWATGLAPTSDEPSGGGLAFYPPVPALEIFAGVQRETWGLLAAVALPMGLFNLIGSLQNIESAEAAGDSYRATPALAMNGLGTLGAAAFGSCFPTTIYIGHPGWKAMGARSGYSILNAAFFSLVAFSGTLGFLTWLIPVDAGMAIVLWIGIVISAQAFQATPRHHAPAVVMGLLPGLAAWGALMLKQGTRAAGNPISEDMLGAFTRADVWVEGAFALEQGFLLTSMILAGMTVDIIERRFRRAACWAVAAAALSACGLAHSFRYQGGDTVGTLAPAWEFVAAYASVAALLAVAPWLTRPTDAQLKLPPKG